jgi:PAX-interacting protein 1
VVIRNLHPSTNANEIGIAIEEIGFTVRQVSNVLHKITKQHLPIFFIDLEPAKINHEIFQLKSLLHTKIKIEEPFKRRNIIQCMICQEYGHSKRYCAHPARCVRCAGNHLTNQCTKSTDLPPTCALCGEATLQITEVTQSTKTFNKCISTIVKTRFIQKTLLNNH